MSYFSRLDGLRGIAILGVLAAHLLPFTGVAEYFGHVGVRLFFVLSGFLITRILLVSRAEGPKEAARRFFWNRALRLLPAYYLLLAVMVAGGLVGPEWPVHALYLSNFLYAATGEWNAAGHFWSLAVEEQFYIAWFVVVVCGPKRAIVPTALFLVVMSPIWRAATFGGPGNPTVLTPAVVDALVAGALLGWASLHRPHGLRWIADWRFVALGATGYVAAAYFDSEVMLGTWVALAGTALVALAVRRDAGTAWLDAAPLQHLGRISYGAYLYHLPIYAVVPLPPIERGIVAAVLTIAASVLSWHLVERRILRARHHQVVELDRVPAGREPGERRIASPREA